MWSQIFRIEKFYYLNSKSKQQELIREKIKVVDKDIHNIRDQFYLIRRVYFN